MDLALSGKVALVAGGTKGIGQAIVESLAAEGTAVAFCAKTANDVQALERVLTQSGHKVAGFVGDVTDPAFLESLTVSSAERFGALDFIVANTGGAAEWGSLEGSTTEQWLATYEMNVGYSVALTRLALPYLRVRGGGSVVFISSISGWKPAPTLSYGTAKAGLIYAAQALARQLAKDSIRVNSVSPGSILVPGGPWDDYRKSDNEGFADFVAREFPWGRLGSAQEVADVVTFLLSDRANWVSGCNVTVDGAQERPSATPW